MRGGAGAVLTGEAARLPAKALLLDGGGLGGGVAVELKEGLGEAPAPPEPFPYRQSYTTIPGPSSFEEEGRSVLPKSNSPRTRLFARGATASSSRRNASPIQGLTARTIRPKPEPNRFKNG
jgi:hypothetical protein